MTRSNPTAPASGPGPDHDVVALLMARHGQIRDLFDGVEETRGDARRDAFRRPVRMPAVHETAEEEFVHPYAGRTAGGGEAIVADRLEEERLATEQLAALDGMDAEDPGFMPALLQLARTLWEHARTEERYEFAQLRSIDDAARVAAMARSVKAAGAHRSRASAPGGGVRGGEAARRPAEGGGAGVVLGRPAGRRGALAGELLKPHGQRVRRRPPIRPNPPVPTGWRVGSPRRT